MSGRGESVDGVDCWRVVRWKFLQQSTPRIPSTRGSSTLLSLGNVGSPIRLRLFDTRLFLAPNSPVPICLICCQLFLPSFFQTPCNGINLRKKCIWYDYLVFITKHDTCPTMRQSPCTGPSCRHHSASANPSASARTSVPSDHPPSSGPAGSL